MKDFINEYVEMKAVASAKPQTDAETKTTREENAMNELIKFKCAAMDIIVKLA